MKQVIQSARTGKLGVREVPAPRVRAGHLLVATRASLISPGTERGLIGFAKKGLAAKALARPDLVGKIVGKARREGVRAALNAALARLDEPLPLGYSAAGEIVAVGAGLEGAFRAGGRVAVAGARLANHAEVNVVPASLVAAVPDGVTDEEAAFATLAAIAMHGVRNLACGLGDVVAVIGTGLVGLIAVRLLVLAGARVVALDYRADRLSVARHFGAEHARDLGEPGAAAAVAALAPAGGADAVLIAAATETSEPLELAAALARDRARIVLLGMTGTEFPYREFMRKELSVVVSRSYGPGRYDTEFESHGVKYPAGYVRWTETANLAECVRLMAPGGARRLEVAPLITHRFPVERAEDAYALLGEGADALGVVLDYPARPTKSPASFPAPAIKKGARCVLGVIGAGAFARSVLLPELKRLPGVFLHTVVTQTGATADHARGVFGFAAAGTDAAMVLDNPDINAIVIATRHASHAGLCCRALGEAKAVFVEKPLALSRAEIAAVVAARAASPAFFQVGFNRRFAPMMMEARRRLAAAAGPRFLVIRVNAGDLDAASWVADARESGGRVLGEMCHFVDLARFLVDAPIVSVQAGAAAGKRGASDDVAAALHFADGSLATVAYTALGDAGFGKELVEAFAGGAVVTVEDVRRLTVTAGGRTSKKSARAADKGHRAQLAAFVAAVIAGGPPPIPEAELVETSTATVAIAESLAGGARVDL